MTKKMVFFDIDGTLYNEEKQIPSSTVEAIVELKKKGHEVAIATGRSPFNITTIREQLNIDHYVTFNGQYVVVDGQVVYKNPIATDALEKLRIHSERYQHPIVFLDHEQWNGNAENHPHIEEAVRSLAVSSTVGFDPDYFRGREIYQSFLFFTEDEVVNYEDSFATLDFIRWHEYAVDVLPRGGSKAKGIQAAIDYLNIHPENVYAFGDGLNDVEMLSFVHNSVAMGNGHDQAKHAAKYVTKHVDEDGIVYGLKMVGLL